MTLAAAAKRRFPRVWEVPSLPATIVLEWLKPLAATLALVSAVMAVAASPAAASTAGDSAGLERWRQQIDEGYQLLWTELESEALRVAEELAEQDLVDDRDALFERLGQLRARQGVAQTLLLLDDNGEAIAWTGEALRAEAEAYEFPRAGAKSWRSYASVTLVWVAPLSQQRRPWRVVVGISVAQGEFPFADLASSQAPSWTIASPELEPPPGVWKISAPDAPALFVTSTLQPTAAPARSGSVVALWLGALVLVFGLWLNSRSSGLQLPHRRQLGIRLGRGLATLVGAMLLVSGSGAGAQLAMAFGASLLLLWLGWGGGCRWPAGSYPLGAGAGLALTLGGWLFQRDLVGAVDLAGRFLETGGVAWLRLGICFAWLGALLWIGGGRLGKDLDSAKGQEGSGPRAGWPLVSVAAAAAFHDEPTIALPFIVLAAATASGWWRYRGRQAGWSGLGVLLLLAALIGSSAWQWGQRLAFRQQIGQQIQGLVAPPTANELNAILIETQDHFEGLDLDELLPILPQAEVKADDLALLLWQSSPLPRRDGLSALLVDGNRGERSSFSFGMSLGPDLEPTPRAERWALPDSAAWHDALIQGEAVLRRGDQEWGAVRYFFTPRPGFRGDSNENDELAEALVQGRPRTRGASGLPPGVLYGLFDFDGRALSSPWHAAPPLAPEAREQPEGKIQTPVGRFWYWADQGADGIEMLFLSHLGPWRGVERVATQALAGLVMVLALAAMVVPWLLPGSTPIRLFQQAVKSYSGKLLLVYTVLLLVPLITLNLVLLKGFEERLRQEQLERAQEAIGSARELLLDYLSGLEPGILIETKVNRELLEWISGLVEHQVNLYWGGRLYSSSQNELFTTGLLPARIPGEVFRRVGLQGYDLSFRTQRGEEVTYLEVYAPIDVPFLAASQQQLFLSVPLLEQEESVVEELAKTRRRAILVTAALFLLLMSVGARLTRSFTKPIMELIEGTRRIAQGDSMLRVVPKDTELSALADAIDVMAHRVDESRRGLVQEKQFVERVVANIASGVLSLDGHQRIVVQNRVAGELLGTEVGQTIRAVAESRPYLQPVWHFLTAARDQGKQVSDKVKLRPDDHVEILEWALTWIPLPGAEDPVELLVVDDATEILRGQRLEAWAEMARIIAHEIKNPLTPIRLSTEHMQQVYRSSPDRFDEVFDRCASNILHNVEELRELATEFSIYSRIPLADRQEGDLAELMADLAEIYRDAAGDGVRFEFESKTAEVRAEFDKKLFTRAVRNLLENSLRAVTPTGGKVHLAVGSDGADAWVRVDDSGPGVDPQKLERIFEPYFSTHETGTGLGLAIARRIVEEHGGHIEARNRAESGLSVLITIPRASKKS